MSGRLVILVFLITLVIPSNPLVPRAFANSRTSAIGSAISWLVNKQLSDGSYGFYSAPQAAPAANALWIWSGDTSNVRLSYGWLKNELQNSTTWFWGGASGLAEADIPGEVLYSFAVGQHLSMLDMSVVGPRLLSLQQSDGGFTGYYDAKQSKQVTSSVDTAMAVLGLMNARAISSTNQQSAISYLLSVQNPDGSFNLTRTIASDSLYSLGPEPTSITALVLLVLKDASFTKNDSHVSSALTFLEKQVTTNFNGHVYAAALAARAFTEFHLPTNASASVAFVLTQQNADGGFRDTARSSTGSNPLDTGWATLAMEVGGLTGDLNLDGVVNIADLTLVGSSFGSSPGDPAWKAHADVNGDGVVNIADLVLVAANFGKTADSL